MAKWYVGWNSESQYDEVQSQWYSNCSKRMQHESLINVLYPGSTYAARHGRKSCTVVYHLEGYLSQTMLRTRAQVYLQNKVYAFSRR